MTRLPSGARGRREAPWVPMRGPAPERIDRAIARHGAERGVRMVVDEEALLDRLQAQLARGEITPADARRMFSESSTDR